MKGKKGSKGKKNASSKRGDSVMDPAMSGLPRSIMSKHLGTLVVRKVAGETVYEGDFMINYVINTASVSQTVVFTPASLAASFASTQFSRFYNNTNPSLGCFLRWRPLKLAFTAIPALPGLATITVGTAAGAYALITGAPTGAGASSISDVLQEESSMLYIPPTLVAGGTVTGPEYCSKPGKTVEVALRGTDAPWVDTTTPSGLVIASSLNYGIGTATSTSTGLLTMKCQFKGWGYA